MDLLRCFLLASAPSFFWMWLYYRRDRWEPEPKLLVLKLFAYGALVAAPVYYLEGWLPGPHGRFYDCFVRVGLVEELFKFLPVLWFASRRREFNEPMDGIIYAVAAALGFATVENTLYAFLVGDEVIVYRAFTSTLAHVGFSGLLGYQLGRAKFIDHGGRWIVLRALFAVVVLHGTYDLLLAYSTHPLAPAGLAQGTVVVMVPLLLLLLCWATHQADLASPFREKPGGGGSE